MPSKQEINRAEVMASLDTSAPNVGTRFRRAMCAGSTPLLIECPKCDQHRLRQEHKAGEKMFVDWAGATIPVWDRRTGIPSQAPLFVAALGASTYTFAEATRDQQMESWLRAHVHAFEYFGGIPALAVPDNTKTGVTKAHRYDPDLNPTYYNFALHCGFGIVPARPYRPRDKGLNSYCTS